MLLPPLKTQQDYVDLAVGAGLEVLGEPKDISGDVSKTWYVHLFFLFRGYDYLWFPTGADCCTGRSRGRWFKTPRSGRSPSARGGTASPFCRRSAL
jgi:hypothetical protein